MSDHIGLLYFTSCAYSLPIAQPDSLSVYWEHALFAAMNELMTELVEFSYANSLFLFMSFPSRF